MAQASSIEWTDATWNPIRGCSRKSEGCRFCYAERIAARFNKPGMPYEGLARRVGGEARWTGKVQLVIDNLDEPLHWRKPRRIFVNSMSDLFHEDVPDAWIDRIFATMAVTPQHTYQILTKRVARMRAYLTSRNGMGNTAICTAINSIDARRGDRKGALKMPLPNVWLGVSIENQDAAEERIPELLKTPAAVRFLSCEPLIDAVDLTDIPFDAFNLDATTGRVYYASANAYRDSENATAERLPRLSWVICGGESGPGARPMHPEWARDLRDQCEGQQIPFFFKQWGQWLPGVVQRGEPLTAMMQTGERFTDHAGDAFSSQTSPDWKYPHLAWNVGKKRAGRKLDGDTWDEFPKVPA